MNYMFTLSTVITNASITRRSLPSSSRSGVRSADPFCLPFLGEQVAALPVGALLDQIGPKYTSLLGALVFAAGNVIFPLGYTGV